MHLHCIISIVAILLFKYVMQVYYIIIFVTVLRYMDIIQLYCTISTVSVAINIKRYVCNVKIALLVNYVRILKCKYISTITLHY